MKLADAIDNLLVWQKAEKKAGRSTAKRCLEAVRRALLKEGLKLPQSNIDYPSALAIGCGSVLLRNPDKWGWKQVHTPLPELCLLFFKNCGKLADGRIAGHVAILDTRKHIHYANTNWHLSQWWADRIIAAFVPK